jgi:CYTH domain-containing protein
MASELQEKTIQEIERKWVLKRLPRDVFESNVEVIHLEYAYLEGKRFTKRTVAGKDSDYWITTKKGEGLSREESHKESHLEEFTKAKKDFYSNCLSKTRYTIFRDTFDIEIDYYHNFDLVTMEVEIEVDIDADHERAAERFATESIHLPESVKSEIISEVTNLPGFSNKNLAE